MSDDQRQPAADQGQAFAGQPWENDGLQSQADHRGAHGLHAAGMQSPRLDALRFVELHIEELVLHGFSAADRQRIGAAVERELARLLAERGVPPSLARSGDLGRLDTGSLNIANGDRPEGIGIKLAQTIYGELGDEQ